VNADRQAPHYVLSVFICKKNREFCPMQHSTICFYKETVIVYFTVRVGTLSKENYLKTERPT